MVSANVLKNAAQAFWKSSRNSMRSWNRSSGAIISPSGSLSPENEKRSASNVPVHIS